MSHSFFHRGPVKALGALAIAAIWPSVAAAAAAGGQVALQPHRAVYDLELAKSTPGGGIGDVRGRIVYELTGNACEGYAQNMRFVTETINSDGAPETSDLRTSSWESVPAGRLRFAYTTYGNEQLVNRIQGVATKNGDGNGNVKVDVSRPQKRVAEVKGPVYFPIEHSTAVILAARAGKKFFEAGLYDGSEGGEKVYTTTSVIGRSIPAGAQRFDAKFKDAELLAGVRSWPVSISYFAPGEGKADSVPLYEMSFRFHENGVTSDLEIDHGTYSLKGSISELTYLEGTPCPAERP